MRGTNLFGEPADEATELSQYFTPTWLARRAATWIPRTATVLEPSAGRGQLIGGLVHQGHSIHRILAVEVDEMWAGYLRRTWTRLAVICADFTKLSRLRCDAAYMNPPYEEGQDARHVARALEETGQVVAIVKSDFEFGKERDRVLWRHARPVRRALLPLRPRFGGPDGSRGSAERNYVALDIRPADAVGGAYQVAEERWWPDEEVTHG